jgi:hypothetical protein
MKPHVWSEPIIIYDGFCGYKCRDCGAVCFSDYGHDPTPEELAQQTVDGPIPEDCDVAKPLVLAGKFGWDQQEMPPWRDEDVDKWSWSSSISGTGSP